jgi:glucosamine--fructose-6-phosphate aminotransferase (isomerizing)
MCAIIATKSASMLEVLYEGNKDRGNFASSIISLLSGNKQQIHKVSGQIDFNKTTLKSNSQYLIGHLQAPTSAKRVWSKHTSHPFESKRWCVVHNGVLNNWEEIRAKHIDWDVNPVDTAIIPNLLEYIDAESNNELPAHEIIKHTLACLEGTFALCIVDKQTNDVYIARQGSILHYNDNGDVSSLEGKGFKVLPEGIIMKLEDFSNWVVVDTFKTNSPFIFL